LATRVAARTLPCPAQFTEKSIEDDPAWARKLGITTVPTILVYRRGTTGWAPVDRKSPPFDEAEASAWLTGAVKPLAFVRRDPNIVRTGGHRPADTVQASPQQVAQPPACPPQQVAQPPQVSQPPTVVQQPTTTMTLQTTPTVSTPITGPQAPPVVLQSPASPVVLQPAPMHVMVGPAPAPVVTFVQGSSPAPQVSVATVTPTQSQQNLFVSGPQVQTQQPSMASPQQHVQVATPSAGQTPTVQQQTVQLVPSVQTTQPAVQAQAGSSVQTALVLKQPHLLNRLLGALGRYLAQKGNPVLMMNNTPTAMTVQVPTTLTIQSPTVAMPQQMVTQQVASPPAVQAPPPVAASPQSGHCNGFGCGLFHHH
jgi:hypothetical protein